jgi:hypothetical protein
MRNKLYYIYVYKINSRFLYYIFIYNNFAHVFSIEQSHGPRALFFLKIVEKRETMTKGDSEN